jgi:hypothetical protein
MILAMRDEIDLSITAPAPEALLASWVEPLLTGLHVPFALFLHLPTSQDGRAAPPILRQTPYAATSTMISRFGFVMSLTR